MASKLFDQLDNQEIDSGDYASHGEQMLHCWKKKKQNNPASQKPNQTNPALHQVIRAWYDFK